MGLGSFLIGLGLGASCNSSTVYHKTSTVTNIPIQYPNDWDDYSNDKKLKWLKDRCYWSKYYELLSSQRKHVEFKLIDDENGNISYKIFDSIIKNKGDTHEALNLLNEYINKKYTILNDFTVQKIKFEISKINEYIQSNSSNLDMFYKPIESYYFKFENN